MSHRGSQFNWVGALANNTVGGMRMFPPRVEKIWAQKINVKERKKALRSAISATVHKNLVQLRGHVVPSAYPFVLSREFEQLASASDVESALTHLDLGRELERVSVRSIKAGRSKTRGRGTREKSGPLLVVSKPCPLMAAARNIPGVDVVVARRLGVQELAPGSHPARLTLFTQAALDVIAKEGLFQ